MGDSQTSREECPARGEGDELSFFERTRAKLCLHFALRHWRTRILLHSLSAMQMPVDLIYVKCDDSPSNAGFSPLHRAVWVCANKIYSPRDMRQFVTHELVHAFDFARAEVNPSNVDHVACTEIRAYNLSEQCSLSASRLSDSSKYFNVPQLHHQTERNRCVAHHAVLSILQMENAPTLPLDEATSAVSRVFERCIHDTWPFMGPPERDSAWRPSRVFFDRKVWKRL
eukprot:GHVN01083608.1.p2 GENE.GHVN01083608.1~~GHVN01083608.1.p2  ORF type:complete len:227 (+),score=14.54 GHVN01083608.1:762-1442(+)